ncbi:Glycolipid transfer protein domain containing protein [Trema orientale]|uniref:Glycolipid transfer protein domain containing protein n=1 Tax=Trema orientale TaxID=63057 RepID=A0A2P5FPD9_TREOI|nr:Glycolipid transfer protein domain containing protein [Trema orientale]
MENKVRSSDYKGSSSSEIRSAIEELSMMVKALNKPPPEALVVKMENGNDHDHINDHARDHHDDDPMLHIPTKPFLSLCNNLVLQVLDKIGPTMTVLRQDVHENIQRLEMLHESDPSVYSNMVEMVKKEVSEGVARKGASCSKAFVWLTRSLDFVVALLQKLAKDPGQMSMEQAVEEAYTITLKPWHRWISSAAYRVALKLVPDHQTFISLLLAKDKNYETLKEEMQTLIVLLVPFLEEIHSVLRLYGLDRLKSS